MACYGKTSNRVDPKRASFGNPFGQGAISAQGKALARAILSKPVGKGLEVLGRKEKDQANVLFEAATRRVNRTSRNSDQTKGLLREGN